VQQLSTISPTTNKPIISRDEPSDAELKALPERSAAAFASWSKTDLSERQKIVRKAVELLLERQDELAQELTEQMGRPIAYAPIEIKTAAKRAEYMLKISEESLKDTQGEQEQGFTRYIKKVPVGPVLVIFAWNVSRFATCIKIYYLHRSSTLISFWSTPSSPPCSPATQSSSSHHRKRPQSQNK